MPPGGDLIAIEKADTVIVPYADMAEPAEHRIIETLRTASRRGARMVSFCRGAFLLAQPGLLDGRRATTHWRYAESFRARFPRVTLDPNVLFVAFGCAPDAHHSSPKGALDNEKTAP